MSILARATKWAAGVLGMIAMLALLVGGAAAGFSDSVIGGIVVIFVELFVTTALLAVGLREAGYE